MALLQEQLGEHELALESTQLNLPDLEVDKESVETQLGQARLEFSQKQQQVLIDKAPQLRLYLINNFHP